MEIIYITIPLVLIVGSLVVAMFIWMAKKGQFDDLDGAAHRILLEDDAPETPSAKTANSADNLNPKDEQKSEAASNK